jgi:hypothetical protein
LWHSVVTGDPTFISRNRVDHPTGWAQSKKVKVLVNTLRLAAYPIHSRQKGAKKPKKVPYLFIRHFLKETFKLGLTVDRVRR